MSIRYDAGILGIEVGDQWPDEMIQKAVDEKLNEGAESPGGDEVREKPKRGPAPKKAKKPEKTINNISGVRCKVYGQIVQPGGSYTPTDADLEDQKGGKRIENAIEKGYLARG